MLSLFLQRLFPIPCSLLPLKVLFPDIAHQFRAIQTITSAYLQQNVIKKAIAMDNYLVDKLGSSFRSYLDSWLATHPVLGWLVNHPVISLCASLIVIVLVIRLLVTIYRAIAGAIDRMWLWILQSPWLLAKFLFGWEAKPKSVSSNMTITNYEVTNNSEHLQEIVARLDKIQQQQERILQDIAQLKQKPKTISPQQIELAAAQATKKQ